MTVNHVKNLLDNILQAVQLGGNHFAWDGFVGIPQGFQVSLSLGGHLTHPIVGLGRCGLRTVLNGLGFLGAEF